MLHTLLIIIAVLMVMAISYIIGGVVEYHSTYKFIKQCIISGEPIQVDGNYYILMKLNFTNKLD